METAQQRTRDFSKDTIELQTIFDSLEDVTLIIDVDYNVNNINNSGLALLSRSQEEVVGEKCYQVLYSRIEPCVFCPFSQTLNTGKAQSIERYDESFGKHFCIKSTPILNASFRPSLSAGDVGLSS